MSKDKLRIFALLLVIGAPVFFFLVFKPLSKIPRPRAPQHFYPQGVKATKLDDGTTQIDSVYQTIDTYTYTDQRGEIFTTDSLLGNVYVAEFFFASCPGICPVMATQLERIQKTFIKDANFRLASFTVDPARDSVPVLREYARNHHAIAGRWSFLLAPKETTYTMAKESFHLFAKEDEDGGPEAFVHSEKLTLVDQNGVIRGYYNGVDSSSVNKLMGDIVLVLRETESNYSFRKNPKKRGGLGKE
jgi:protein SCO1